MEIRRIQPTFSPYGGIGASLYATTDEGTPEERTLRREANTNAGTFNRRSKPGVAPGQTMWAFPAYENSESSLAVVEHYCSRSCQN
jgi:hypothetical protein